MSPSPAHPRRALLVGDPNLMWPLPPMLSACGFDVEVVTVPGLIRRKNRYLRQVTVVDSLAAALRSATRRATDENYDWIVLADDTTLRLLRTSKSFTAADRARLAPVRGLQYVAHLASKVDLAQRLDRLPVLTPRFHLAVTAEEARDATEQFHGTSLLKPDFGSGGAGIILATNPTEAAVAWHLMAARQNTGQACSPAADAQVLVQEFRAGRPVDVSAIFLDGQLIHYTYAHLLPGSSRFGATPLRHYFPTVTASPQIPEELRTIGVGLGLHGFTNITCIESPDGATRHYFEVDARPNLWAAFGAQFGDDPVARLRAWFDEGQVLLNDQSLSDAMPGSPCPGQTPSAEVPPSDRDVALFWRLSRRDLLRNRYHVWRDVPWRSPEARRAFFRRVLG